MQQLDDAPAVIRDYMDAFAARDLPRCLEMYEADASIEYGPARYQGAKALEDWHRARFNADLKVVRIDDIEVDDNIVTIAGVVTSKRLKLWRITNLSGRARFHLHEGKIREVSFGLRTYNPLEAYRA
ncbi:MAG TPA: nuclear transport factor 2 family protein [Chloroflexota bacterium]|nr:nuclear transport factor 2 family protein [Chloroflexota bacterium]